MAKAVPYHERHPSTGELEQLKLQYEKRIAELEAVLCTQGQNRREDSIHTIEDITGERRHREEQQMLSEALRQAGEAVLITDASQRIQYANAAARSLLGFSPQSLVGKSLSLISVPEQEEALQAEQVMRRVCEREAWSGEILCRDRDGAAVPVYVRASAIRGRAGELLGCVGAYADLRPLKAAQRRAQSLHQAVEELSVQEDLQAMVPLALEAARRATGAELAGLALLEQDGRLRYHWLAGLAQEAEEAAATQPFAAGTDVAGVAMERCQVIATNDYASFPGALPALRGSGLRHMLAVPVAAAGRTVAALVAGATRVGADFSTDDVRFLETIARQLGAGLHRDQLTNRLRCSEAEHRQMVETVPVVLYRARAPEIVATLVSPAIRSLLGFTPQEFCSDPQNWSRHVHADDRQRVMEGFQAAFEGGDSYALEYRMWHRDGRTLRWVLDQGQVERDAQGRPVAIYGTGMDISQRKAAEAALQASEARFRQVVDAVPDILFLLHLPDLVPTFVSPACQRVLGYAPQEYLTDPDLWQRQIHPDDRERVLGELALGIAHRRDFTLEGRFLHREPGRVVWVSGRISVQLDAQGEPAAAIGVITDLSEQVLARQALRRSEERYQMLFESMMDGFALHEILRDEDGRPVDYRFLDVNPAFERITSLAREQILGRTVREALPGVEQEWIDVYAGVVQSGEPLRFESYSRVLDKHFDVLAFGAGQERFATVFTDISARRRSESRLQGVLEQTIQAVALTVEKRDPYTAGHQRRAAELAVAIAREMGLSDALVRGLLLGATIHDIGKIYTPAEILNRPGKLSAGEFELIKTHPRVGYDIVAGIDFPWPVAQMILQHHERLDGSGYPQGLQGDDIILEARILAVADVVEATASHRPYRPALGVEFALNEIRKGRGRLFDADVVDACARVFSEEGFSFDSASAGGPQT